MGSVTNPGNAARAVLFDMDGTLVDSIASVDQCWDDLVTAMGLVPADTSFAHGVPAEANVRAVLGDVDEATVQHWVQVHLDLEIAAAKTVTPYPGAGELLAYLDEQAIPWGIATSCTRPLADARLNASGLPRPVVFASADEYDRPKPHPDPFVYAGAQLGVPSSEAIVVEDAPAGVASGRAAGAIVVAVTTTHSRDELDDAHLVVDSLVELMEVLRRADGLQVIGQS